MTKPTTTRTTTLATSTSHMAREMLEQPGLVRELSPAWEARAQALLPGMRERRQLVVVGRGSSGNAATYATYLAGLASGRQAIELRPWLTTRTEPADHSDAVALAYSVSGRSTDVAQAAAWLRRGGALVVGVTNATDDCALSKAADEVVRLDVGPELAVPATKTFNAQLLVSAVLCGVEISREAEEIASCMEALLEGDTAERLADFLEGARHVFVVGRGLTFAAALDGALKLEETARVAATGFSAAEVLHGPVGAAVEHDRALLLDDGDLQGEAIDATLVRLLARKTPALVISPEEERGRGLRPGALHLPLPKSAWARPTSFALLLQLAAFHLAVRQGLDPDAPAQLSKVTET